MSSRPHPRPEATITALAHYLDLDPDTVLRLTVRGQLEVSWDGQRLIIRLSMPLALTKPLPEQILVINAPPASSPEAGSSSPCL